MKNLDMSKLILYTCFQSYFCLLKSCFGKCLHKMSAEKLFEKFVKSAEIFKSDKSGQQKNLYRLVNQLDLLFILPPICLNLFFVTKNYCLSEKPVATALKSGFFFWSTRGIRRWQTTPNLNYTGLFFRVLI